jgi:hypothetical protein
VFVLGVDVPTDLLGRWHRWLAPTIQPFFVASVRPWPKSSRNTARLSPELRDTYKAWKLDRSLKLLWLDEKTFFGMSHSERALLVRSQARHGRGAVPTVRGWLDLLDPATLRSQADGHRFVWWPSVLDTDADAIVCRALATDGLRSRHLEVASKTWDECVEVLPAARDIGGSFPPSSGPNCFGTVMAAAGVAGAADVWMLQAPFLAWLASACRTGGRDDEPGTVLLWRDDKGLPVHAAVTIGEGWALEKASQAWSTPRAVLTVEDVIRTNRARGQRLERHCITSSPARPLEHRRA